MPDLYLIAMLPAIAERVPREILVPDVVKPRPLPPFLIVSVAFPVVPSSTGPASAAGSAFTATLLSAPASALFLESSKYAVLVECGFQSLCPVFVCLSEALVGLHEV